MGFIPNSVLVGQLWPDVVVENTIPKQTFKLRDEKDYEEEVRGYLQRPDSASVLPSRSQCIRLHGHGELILDQHSNSDMLVTYGLRRGESVYVL